MKTLISSAAISLLVLSTSCVKNEPIKPSNVVVTAVSDTLKTGTFITKDAGHPTQGKVYLIKKIDGSTVIQFENFSTGGGPDVDILAGKTDSYSSSTTIKIDDLKNSGSFYIDVTQINTTEYPHILIWCRQFDVMFGSATLN